MWRPNSCRTILGGVMLSQCWIDCELCHSLTDDLQRGMWIVWRSRSRPIVPDYPRSQKMQSEKDAREISSRMKLCNVSSLLYDRQSQYLTVRSRPVFCPSPEYLNFPVISTRHLVLLRTTVPCIKTFCRISVFNIYTDWAVWDRSMITINLTWSQIIQFIWI